MFYQIGVERKNHEGHVGVDDADIDRKTAVQHLNRFVQYPGPDQQVVEIAVIFQNPHPGVDSDQKRSPGRQNHQHQQQVPPVRRSVCHGIGNRVTDE